MVRNRIFYGEIEKLRFPTILEATVYSETPETSDACGQTESKTIVKENMLQNSCVQELQDGTGMD